MTHSAPETDQFGCPECWPPAPDDAWRAREFLDRDDLIDESHFIVALLTCADCGQVFLSVFTETIDWEDGDDPQHWTVLPLTGSEAATLVEKKGSLTERDLLEIGASRRSLRLDAPKGKPSALSWGSGLLIGPHD